MAGADGDFLAAPVKNTFIHVAPVRSPSLEGFLRERRVRSCPSTPNGGRALEADSVEEVRWAVPLQQPHGLPAPVFLLPAERRELGLLWAPQPSEDTGRGGSSSSSARPVEVGNRDPDLAAGGCRSSAFVSPRIQLPGKCASSGSSKVRQRDLRSRKAGPASPRTAKTLVAGDGDVAGGPSTAAPVDKAAFAAKAASKEHRPPIWALPMICASFFCLAMAALCAPTRPARPPQPPPAANQESAAAPTPQRLDKIVNPLLTLKSGLGCNVAEMEPEPHLDVPQLSFEAFQDALEGVSGLVRRMEQLQPLLGSSAGSRAAEESRRLHQRFAALMGGLRSAGASGESLMAKAQELGLFAFHRDLALFVRSAELEARLPQPPAAGIGGDSLGAGYVPPLPTPGPTWVEAFEPGPAPSELPELSELPGVSPETQQRVHNAMSSIVTGMRHFEALAPALSMQPWIVVQELSRRGQELDEQLLSLQQRGRELVSGHIHDAEGGHYAAQLEALAEAQAIFLRDTEAQLRRGGQQGLR